MQNTTVLVRRLLKKELDPVAVVAMSPKELKVCCLSKHLILFRFITLTETLVNLCHALQANQMLAYNNGFIYIGMY